MHLVYCSADRPESVQFLRERVPAFVTIETRDPSRELREQVEAAEVVVPGSVAIDAALMASMRKAKLIQLPCIGYETVDIVRAGEIGVPVCNAPANANAVAEEALLMMLALVRRYPEAQARFREARIGAPVGSELRGKTLGVIGAGYTGAQVAEVARAIGMHVLTITGENSRTELERVVEIADIVSIHVPLVPSTRGMFDDELIGRMKTGAFLLNCARGPIIDRGALERALASGKLAGFGADVHWVEPWDPTDPIYQSPRVVSLPHIGAATREAFARTADIIAENVRRLANGEALLHRIA